MRDDLDQLVAATAAAHAFSGAVQVTLDRSTALAEAFGEADRSAGIRNTVDTRFGIASGTKFLTALAAGALIDDGVLALDDRLVDVVSVPLPGVSAAVAIGHLLTHAPGVCDYLDEDVIDADHFELPIVARTPLHYIVGSDPGVSFHSSAHSDGTFATVVSNTSKGAWPMIKVIDDWIRSNTAGS